MKTDTTRLEMMAGAPQTAPEPELIVRAILAETRRLNSAEVFPVLEPDPLPEESAEVEPGPMPPGRLRGYRPSARLVAWLAFGVIVVSIPGIVAGLGLFALALAAITYFTLGHDRMAEISSGYLSRLEARNPARASALRARLDRLGGGLARILPERLADQLGLADGAVPMHPKLAQDPFERLAREAVGQDLRT